MKQNITLSLDMDLLVRAKVLAAKRNTSISRMLAEELETKVRRSEDYERAHRAALALMQDRLPLGGKPFGREALHER